MQDTEKTKKKLLAITFSNHIIKNKGIKEKVCHKYVWYHFSFLYGKMGGNKWIRIQKLMDKTTEVSSSDT